MATATPLEWLLFGVIAVAAGLHVWLLIDGVLALATAHQDARKFPAYDFTTILDAGRGQVRQRITLSLVQVLYLTMAITLLLTMPVAPTGPPPPVTLAGLIIRWGLIASELLLVYHGLDLRATAWQVRRGVQERGGD